MGHESNVSFVTLRCFSSGAVLAILPEPCLHVSRSTCRQQPSVLLHSSARIDEGTSFHDHAAVTSVGTHIALGGLPGKMRVEVDPGIQLSPKTVGELRKLSAWPESLAVTTPQNRDNESAVTIVLERDYSDLRREIIAADLRVQAVGDDLWRASPRLQGSVH
jgi:hypothetical protein